MPSIRKWKPEEFAALAASKNGTRHGRKEIEAIYDQRIAELTAGDYATVMPDEGDTKPTVCNHLIHPWM